MLKNFLCVDSLIASLFIVDGILIVAAIGLLVWYLIRNKKKNAMPTENKPMSKLDDETYIIDDAVQQEEMPVHEDDNEVVHFVNQITDINEDVNNELNTNTVVVTHEVEYPVKKIVAKEEIANFVEVGGEKKTKTEEEIATSVNRGTNSFKNATNFLNTIKTEQYHDALSSKKVVKKK